MSKSKLIINFVKNPKLKKYYDSLIFLKKSYPIKNKTLEIDIDDKYFNDLREKIVVDFSLVPLDILSDPIQYKMNIFYGINKAYCFLTEVNKILIEYSFIDEQRIFYDDYELKEYDGNGLVKRIVLINSPYVLDIYNKRVTFLNLTILFDKALNSFEINDFDYSNLLFGVRPIKVEEKYCVINDIKKQKQELEKLFLDLKQLIEKKIEDKNKYKNIFNNLNIKEYTINFSQKKNLLEDEFKSKDDYYVMFLYWIWYSIKSSYLNEKYNCKISIIDIFNNINNFYGLYLKDEKLKIYQKVLLFCSHVSFFLEKNSVEEYKAANLEYIKKEDIIKESIYKLSFNFLDEFISELNEKSYLLFPLLMLDSGNFYDFKKKDIYGFNRESCNVVKAHLRELIPEIFFEYNDKVDIVKEENGFNYKGFGVVFINRLAIFKNLKISPSKEKYKDDNEKRVFKHYGMLASKTLMHESFCHNKILFDKKERVISPSQFYNRKKTLVLMIPVSSNQKEEQNIKYFKSLNKKLSGESGKFFEYFFGKYTNNVLVIDLIFKIDYIGNLLDNVKYFVKEDLQELQKYIINKYKITNYKDVAYDDKDLSFEDEIKKMEGIITNKEKMNKKEKEGKKDNEKDNENDNENVNEKDNENDNENDNEIFESKKDTNFFEVNFNEKEINEEKEKNEDSLPFFKALHKA